MAAAEKKTKATKVKRKPQVKSKTKAKAKPKTKTKAKIGRPRSEPDQKMILSLAKIGCTYQEIASCVGCSVRTLKLRFRTLIKTGWDDMKCSLRRMQYLSAAGGSIAAQIWLGKQYLGQRDNVGIGNIKEDDGFVLILPDNGRLKPQPDRNGNGNGSPGTADSG